jgi:hypothetical protein
LIPRDKSVELQLSFFWQHAILQLSPAHLLRRANRVARQEPAQWTRLAGIEQHFLCQVERVNPPSPRLPRDKGN